MSTHVFFYNRDNTYRTHVEKAFVATHAIQEPDSHMVQTRLVMPRELLPSQAFSSHGLHQDFHSNWVPKREGSSDPTWPASWPWRPTIFEIEANILSNHSPSPWTQCPKECQLDSAEAIARPYWGQEPRDQEGPRWRRSKWHWKPKFVWPGGCRVCSQKRKFAAPISSVVTITVGQKQVDCLASGSKPTRSDFAVLLDPDHLEPVISHLRSSIAAALELPTINLKSKEWSSL